MHDFVRVITSDGRIWNRDSVVFDILRAAQLGPVNINLLHEGPDCVMIGIDSMLDDICAYLDVTPEFFTIYTANQLTSSRYPEVRLSFAELETAVELANQYQPSMSTLQKRFGIFIGRSNWQRLCIAGYLGTQYQDQTEMTFHYDPTVDFHASNLGLEELAVKHPVVLPQVAEFLQRTPIKHDAQQYPILWDQQGFALDKQYKNIFCEVICETYFSGRTFFITEKTFRCIINRRPFMVQGPQYYLKNLQTLGFQTFSTWWDESYDQDPADARGRTLCNNIDWIAKQSHEVVDQWYKQMQPVLEHNVSVLQNLTAQQLLTTQFYHE